MIRIGTRASPLAQTQTDRVLAAIAPTPVQKIIVESQGDLDLVTPLHRMQRPGAFTHSLTDAILDGRIDAAVHSLKDLPLQAPDEAPIVAILKRDDAADVLLARNDHLDPKRPFGLTAGSRVGTSAPRRQSQIADADPELICVDVRGNIGTRIKLLQRGAIDGLLMAAAAIERLQVALPNDVKAIRLDPQRFPTCPGQGAIAVQACRGTEAARVLGRLDDTPTRAAVERERAILASLGGGCGLPLGVHATPTGQIDATFGHSGTQPHLARWSGTAHDLLNAAAVLKAAKPGAPSKQALGNGLRVLLTLSADRLSAYRAILAPAGFRVDTLEVLHAEPTDIPLPDSASQSDWIAVTSPRAAAYAVEAASAIPRARMAAVGPATAQALRGLGLPVHAIAHDGTGAGLAQTIHATAPPVQVLAVQAAEPAGGLTEDLQAMGCKVVAWSVYRTLSRQPSGLPAVHAILLTSPSAVQGLAPLLKSSASRLLAFGPTTAAAMRDAGLPIHAVCAHRTPQSVLEALQ
ncbi:MAG: hydroxymethylbilane synthase [Thermoplasmatota archaeon]